MFSISTLFRTIMLMHIGTLGVILKIVFVILYLLFLLYAFRRYNFGNASFGERAEDFRTPFVATAFVSAVFAILLDLWRGPVVIVLLIISEIALLIWAIIAVSKYVGEISVIGNVIFWFIVAVCVGQIGMIFAYAIIASILVVAILFLVLVYVIANELGSF